LPAYKRSNQSFPTVRAWRGTERGACLAQVVRGVELQQVQDPVAERPRLRRLRGRATPRHGRGGSVHESGPSGQLSLCVCTPPRRCALSGVRGAPERPITMTSPRREVRVSRFHNNLCEPLHLCPATGEPRACRKDTCASTTSPARRRMRQVTLASRRYARCSASSGPMHASASANSAACRAAAPTIRCCRPRHQHNNRFRTIPFHLCTKQQPVSQQGRASGLALNIVTSYV